ncbi:MAG: hypothetical protein H7287_07885 [Thermoleophilia bacterium]|nr:hypothetical protein [Thermoleophilia bacterium]
MRARASFGPLGDVYLAGTAIDEQRVTHAWAVHFTPAGVLDPSFDAAASVARMTSIDSLLLAGEKLLIGGSDADARPVITSLTLSGASDEAYGTVHVAPATTKATVTALTPDASGRTMVIYGRVSEGASGSSVVRVGRDGVLDGTWKPGQIFPGYQSSTESRFARFDGEHRLVVSAALHFTSRAEEGSRSGMAGLYVGDGSVQRTDGLSNDETPRDVSRMGDPEQLIAVDESTYSVGRAPNIFSSHHVDQIISRFGADDRLDLTWGDRGSTTPPYQIAFPPVVGERTLLVSDMGIRRVRLDGLPDRMTPKLVLTPSRACHVLAVCVSGSGRPTQIAWSATDDSPGVRVERGDAVQLPAARGSLALSPTITARPNCLFLRAVDAVGHASPWQHRCASRPVPRGYVLFGAGWGFERLTGAAGGSVRTARTAGSTIVLKTPRQQSLSGVIIVATTCPRCGSIRVQRTGRSDVVVSLHRATTTRFDRVLLPLQGSALRMSTVGNRPVRIDEIAYVPAGVPPCNEPYFVQLGGYPDNC